MCNDRDLSNGWTGAADGTLEARFYINQNWRGDVAVVTDDVSVIQERTKYSASGGSHAADMSRVSGLTYSGGSRVLYDYLGVGQTVRTVLQEPDCTTALTDNAIWTSVPTYGNVDRLIGNNACAGEFVVRCPETLQFRAAMEIPAKSRASRK